MSSATDTRDRISAGFADLIALLQAKIDEVPSKKIRANTEAREREQNRVWREYGEYGLTPPSDLALSITARLELGLAVVNRPAQEAAE